MINTAVIVSIIDFGTPVFCCIPIAPDFNTARKNAINGPNTMSFLTINDASIPFVPKLYAKLFIISKLKKHKLWMSFDQYLAAMCFTENGKKEIKMLLNMSDDDIDLICKNSEWNKILK